MYMYELNPERNSEKMPPSNHKTALHFKLEKKITGDFFQTDKSANRRYERKSRSQHKGT